MSIALLIGINYYRTSNQLHGCINDCTLIQSMLTNNFGFKSENIVFMRDDIYQTGNSLYPTKANIITQIKNAITKANSTNAGQVYIHYSGHGSHIVDTSGDESDGYDEFIVPIDYFTSGQKIIDDELNVLLHELNNTTQLFCVFDCCMSGTILDLPWNYSLEGGGNTFVQIQESRDNSLADKMNILCISGCRDNEYSLDVSQNGIANGALTLGLYNILKQNNWLVDLKDLIIQLYTFLKDNNYDTQKPLLSSNKRVDISTINFNYKTADAPVAPTPVQPTPAPVQPTPAPVQPTPSQIVEGLLNYFISSQYITVSQLNDIVTNIKGFKIVEDNANAQRIMKLFQ